MSSETKNVRARNVRIGDRLQWYDATKQEATMMVVIEVDLGFPGVQQLSVRRLLASGKPGKTPYQWNMKANSLVRVMREAAK